MPAVAEEKVYYVSSTGLLMQVKPGTDLPSNEPPRRHINWNRKFKWAI